MVEHTGAPLISTFQALAVALVALLPGASYTFAFERVAGSFGVKFSDRLIRFLAASAIFAAILSGPGFLLYRDWVTSGNLSRGRVNAGYFELIVCGYVLLPTLIGSFLGRGSKRKWRWVMPLVGETPEPRAWDYVWRAGTKAVLRIKLKSGNWLGGVFATNEAGRRSYASGYPEDQDLYLSILLQVDPSTGEFRADDQGRPQPVEGLSGLLLRWDEVEYLEVQEF